MSSTEYSKTIILNSLLRAEDFPLINDLVVGLFVSGAEVTAAEYERASISFDATYANEQRIEFAMAASSWGSPNQLILIGAGNNQLAAGTINPGVITAGYRIVIEIGSVVVDLT